MFYYNKTRRQHQYNTDLNIQDILTIIANKTNCRPKKYGNGYRTCCPAHEDRNPSLSISEGSDGKILMYCFVGCEIRDICSSIGIHVRDLFPKKKGY